MSRHVLIMSGGGGTRLWPRSTQACPKPFLKIPGDQTLIEQSFERASSLVGSQNVWVVTTRDLAQITRHTLANLSEDHLILEPQAKNTAAAICLAMTTIEKRHPDASVFVLAADHFIPDVSHFCNTANQAFHWAESEKILVTLGIKPTAPKCDYGYIQVGTKSKDGLGYHVNCFVEKPSTELAIKYLQLGTYLWNSGMFCFSMGTFWSELKKAAPQYGAKFQGLTLSQLANDLSTIYDQVPDLSIDYALMEKSENVGVIPATFAWTDLGTWDSVAQSIMDLKQNENACSDNACVIQGQGNIVLSDGQKFILYGVENLVVVEHEGTTLITVRNKSSDLKKLLQELKKSNPG